MGAIEHMRMPSDSHSSLTFALQALLSRHESYLAESEAERTRLTTTVETLEAEKTSLQDANQDLVKQNRELLDKLEALNTSLGNGDTHVKNLEALLVSAEVETRRLNGLAGRAVDLEQQLRQLERDNIRAKEEAALSREEERSALGRWREAEMKVREMGREVERIEAEASREREAHMEVVKRMERERELGVAAGRLKGIAALKEGDGNGTVVSHFVRDILQDNANLQAGILELREMLQTSNEEVQGLREQIMEHQPVSPSDTNLPGTVGTLDDQIGWSRQKQTPTSQEVHVHHHYHAKFATSTKRIQPRKNSRKRTSIGLLGNTPESSTPSTPTARPHRHFSSPHVPALSIDQPQTRINRWSVQSTATGSSNLSSMPSSPRSYFEQRNMGIFDRLEEDNESSRPTSPESVGYVSPKHYSTTFSHKGGRPSDFSIASFAIPEDDGSAKELTPPLSATEEQQHHKSIKAKESIAVEPQPDTGQTDEAHDLEPDDSYLEDLNTHQTLRRSTSHESLVSISGMDIHLAKRQPSQVFMLTRGLAPNKPSSPRTVSTSQPLASIAEVSATSNKRSFSNDTSSASLALLKQAGHVPPPSQAQPQPRGLGRLVGGWVRGNWGIAPMRSTQDLRSRNATTASVPALEPTRTTSVVSSIASSEIASSSPKVMASSHTRNSSSSSSNANGATPFGSFSQGRPMGINQVGPIPGFVVKRTPSEVHAKVLDRGLLIDALRGEESGYIG
jgi:hypothetical protein